MDEHQMRLECLKLAHSMGSDIAEDVIDVAKELLAFVQEGVKMPPPASGKHGDSLWEQAFGRRA